MCVVIWNTYGVALGGDHHCAQPLIRAFGVDGAARESSAPPPPRIRILRRCSMVSKNGAAQAEAITSVGVGTISKANEMRASTR